MREATLDQPIGVTDAQVFHADGTFRREPIVTWADGLFSVTAGATAAQSSPVIAGRDLWLIPGIVDAHVHLAWTDFSDADRRARGADERAQLVRENLRATLAAGVTSARDAGGLDANVRDRVATDEVSSPRLSLSVDLITRDSAAQVGGLDVAIDRAIAAGAEWIKLVATDGVASPGGRPLESHFSRADIHRAVAHAESAGARVMVHAWGGDAITWSIEGGAASIEHGIFLTEDQARLGAEHGAALVPTLHVYRLVQDMIRSGALPASLRDRVDEAVDAHPAAVRRARDAGMPIALGTDYGTTAQHGHNLVEVAELLRAGLSVSEAITAATSTGASLIARPAVAGIIEDGAVADAILLAGDPSNPETYLSQDAVVAVIQAGRLVAGADRVDIPTQNTARPKGEQG